MRSEEQRLLPRGADPRGGRAPATSLPAAQHAGRRLPRDRRRHGAGSPRAPRAHDAQGAPRGERVRRGLLGRRRPRPGGQAVVLARAHPRGADGRRDPRPGGACGVSREVVLTSVPPSGGVRDAHGGGSDARGHRSPRAGWKSAARTARSWRCTATAAGTAVDRPRASPSPRRPGGPGCTRTRLARCAVRSILVCDPSSTPPATLLERVAVLARGSSPRVGLDERDVVAGIERHLTLPKGMSGAGGPRTIVHIAVQRALDAMLGHDRGPVAAARAATALAAVGVFSGAREPADRGDRSDRRRAATALRPP